jgi:hypothetical protein
MSKLVDGGEMEQKWIEGDAAKKFRGLVLVLQL